MDKGETCPIVEAIREVGNENDLLVIRFLSDGSLGFNEMLRMAGTMSPKTLSNTLKRLQEKGIIVRNIVSTQPFRVVYSLTQKGMDLKIVLNDLKAWGSKWLMSSNPYSLTDNR
ncbi:helix-turn-helix domain-containing protein [Thermoplasma sp.]|uniref:winged helix-turn-helix transcriptional regulator n=1 Tax=Thermoplasma sp. TaxID=1973142 RepID=UPI00127AB70A|nr:helix-turn-helix domain-containing protein [Thermoplasma sp.]KAA8922301.1 MAG: helix-turn-helix transcriptional regulator [Thermoplasma sp.]